MARKTGKNPLRKNYFECALRKYMYIYISSLSIFLCSLSLALPLSLEWESVCDFCLFCYVQNEKLCNWTTPKISRHRQIHTEIPTHTSICIEMDYVHKPKTQKNRKSEEKSTNDGKTKPYIFVSAFFCQFFFSLKASEFDCQTKWCKYVTN